MTKKRMTYAELPTGNFFRIAKAPEAGEFFKCQPWVSTTADLEKLIQFKPEVEVIVTNRSGALSGQSRREAGPDEVAEHMAMRNRGEV